MQHETKETRINKFIADAGLCSRREADRLIESGLVFVNGKPAENGMRITDKDDVICNGKPVKKQSGSRTYLLFYKPKGIVCTAEKKEKNNIIDYISYPTRIMYAGRLDKDSEGLMLLTDDGDLIDTLMRAKNKHEKEYIVSVDKNIDKNFIYEIRNGIFLEELNVTTRKCKATLLDSHTFKIILTEGHNRQIRRMCEALSVNVTGLTRVRIANLKLDNLAPGKYRNATQHEINELFESIGYKK